MAGTRSGAKPGPVQQVANRFQKTYEKVDNASGGMVSAVSRDVVKGLASAPLDALKGLTGGKKKTSAQEQGVGSGTDPIIQEAIAQAGPNATKPDINQKIVEAKQDQQEKLRQHREMLQKYEQQHEKTKQEKAQEEQMEEKKEEQEKQQIKQLEVKKKKQAVQVQSAIRGKQGPHERGKKKH